MRTWVYRVAHNIATTHVVRAKARMPAFLSIDEIESVAVTPDEEALIDRGRVLGPFHFHGWRGQPREEPQMPAENIRAKAERLEQRAVAWRERRRALRIQNEIDELG